MRIRRDILFLCSAVLPEPQKRSIAFRRERPEGPISHDHRAFFILAAMRHVLDLPEGLAAYALELSNEVDTQNALYE
jgi:hypothetical protein